MVPARSRWFSSSSSSTANRVSKCIFTDLIEGFNDDMVVTLSIQLKKALKKILKVFFRVDLLLKDHLKHGVPEIMIWVGRALLNGKAVCERAPFGYYNVVVMVKMGGCCVGFRHGVVGGEIFVLHGGEAAVTFAGSGGGGTGAAEVCVLVVMNIGEFGFRDRLVYFRELCLGTATASI